MIKKGLTYENSAGIMQLIFQTEFPDGKENRK